MNDVREKPGEASQYISINYPVSQSHIYQTPLVHDSPATRTQSSIENLVSQTTMYLKYIGEIDRQHVDAVQVCGKTTQKDSTVKVGIFIFIS